MKDIQKIKEFFSKPMEAITTAYEAKGEYFKPSIRKDKSNPNFLYVDIAYPAGSDVLSIGGSKTMGGQDREAGAAKALSMGNMIAKKLQTKYNIEDIDVSDLKNGKVEVFAVSDDFIKMASPSIDDETKSTIPTKMSYYPSALYKEAEEEETAVDMAKKQLDALGVKYELGNKFKPFKTIYKPTGKSDKFYDTFNDIVDLFNLGNAVKSSMGEAKFMSGLLSGKDFINAKLKNYPKAVAKVNQLIDMIGEDKFTIEMAEWIFDFFNNASYESPMNENTKSNPEVDKLLKIINTKKGGPEYKKALMDLIAMAEKKSGKTVNTKKEALLALDYVEPTIREAKEEDKVDTITMDIPLFLRMLEYSREDASQDMDLHDVTEKAISLGKERGILQMDDYNEIIGTTEEIDEAELTEAYVPSNIKEFAKRKGVSSLVNKVAGWAEKVGKGIRGGTAIGYNYSTLILDMTYQGSEIRINTDNDTIELYDEPVYSFDEFKQVYLDNQDIEENVAPNHDGKAAPYGSGYKPLEEKIAKALDQINEELCPAGKAYRKHRMAAGEKSSAYLSGRAVKVCKGQMSGKKKKK